MSLFDSFFHPEGKRFQVLEVAFNHLSGFLLSCSIAMAQQNWVENPAEEAEEHHHRSGDIKVEQQEWIVVDKVKRAGHKRGDDGGQLPSPCPQQSIPDCFCSGRDGICSWRLKIW